MARIITGLHISAHKIEAIEFSVQRKLFRLLRYIEKPIIEGTVSADDLSGFFSEQEIQKECVVTSVPGDMLITRQLTVPFKDRSKIDKVISFEVEPLVPFPIQELEISYRVLHQEKTKSDLLVYALPRNILDQRSALFEQAQIPLQRITVSSLAAANTLFHTRKISTTGLYLHVHVSDGFSIISIYQHGTLNHLQRLPWGGDAFLKKLSTITDTDPMTVSRDIGTISEKDREALLEILMQETIGLTPHIQKILQTYKMRFQGTNPEQLYVTGDAAGLYLIPPLLQKDLSIRTESPDPLLHVEHEIEKNKTMDTLHTPLGMCLMAADNDSLQCSFREKKSSLVSKIFRTQEELRYAAIVLAVLFIGFVVDLFVGIQAKEYQVKQIQKESQRIFKETYPEVKNVVNELEQMKLKIKEAEKHVEIFKSLFGEKPSPLIVLNNISSLIPEDLELSITDLTIDQKSIRFVGWTDSFNTVNKIEQELKKSEIFGNVNVSNAKVGKDKNQVNFQIKIAYKES